MEAHERKEFTTKELNAVLNLHDSGMPFSYIAKETNRPPATIHALLKRHSRIPIKCHTKSNCNQYSVYCEDSSQIVAFGTAKECSKTLGIKQQSFYVYLWRQNKNKKIKKIYILKENLI